MIKRFDDIEFDCLNAANNGCYYPKGLMKDRALLLMEEGIFEHNPYENWAYSGWKLTEIGKQYWKEFLDAVRERHGHVWKTHRDIYPEDYDEDSEYGNSIDIFAYEMGYHNGPQCKKCGYSFCEHCLSEFDVPECKKK